MTVKKVLSFSVTGLLLLVLISSDIHWRLALWYGQFYYKAAIVKQCSHIYVNPDMNTTKELKDYLYELCLKTHFDTR